MGHKHTKELSWAVYCTPDIFARFELWGYRGSRLTAGGTVLISYNAWHWHPLHFAILDTAIRLAWVFVQLMMRKAKAAYRSSCFACNLRRAILWQRIQRNAQQCVTSPTVFFVLQWGHHVAANFHCAPNVTHNARIISLSGTAQWALQWHCHLVKSSAMLAQSVTMGRTQIIYAMAQFCTVGFFGAGHDCDALQPDGHRPGILLPKAQCANRLSQAARRQSLPHRQKPECQIKHARVFSHF